MQPAIILGMGANGLGVSRALGRKGVDVYGIDKQDDIAFSSKYCKKKYVFPDPASYPEECLEQFIRLGESLDDKAVLLITNDPYVAFVSRFRAELSQYYLFTIPDSSVLENIQDKSKQYRLAENLGIPVPKTISPKHTDDFKEGLISYPAIIKGTDSKKWISAFNNKGIVAHCHNDLLEYLRLALSKKVEVVVQEMIIGPASNNFGVNAYYSTGKELLALFSQHRLRQWPIEAGLSTYAISTNNRELISLGRKYCEGIGYTGVGSMQFKYDDRDGQLKLIELNPRLWLTNILATCAGINVPYIYYLDCIGEKVTPSLTYKENISWLYTVGDIQSFWATRKTGDLSFTEWVKSVLSADCFLYYARDDLKPVCKHYASVAEHSLKRIFRLKT